MSKPGLEADDVCGLLSTKPENKKQCVVVSNDKDLKTIPGMLYRPMSDEMLSVTEQEADKNFLTQCLTGDSTDGYPGVPGIGPKKAEALLGGRPDWGAVRKPTWLLVLQKMTQFNRPVWLAYCAGKTGTKTKEK